MTNTLLYIGTYTTRMTHVDGRSEGIYVYRFSGAGELTRLGAASGIRNPSYLALHPSAPFLYSVAEVDDEVVAGTGAGGRPGGVVAAFRRDPSSGQLTRLGTAPSGGAGPCHLSVVVPHGQTAGRGFAPGADVATLAGSAAGSGGPTAYLVVANYGSGSVASCRAGSDGSLEGPLSAVQRTGSSVNPKRQQAPHAHQVMPDPSGRSVLVPDLGTDILAVYDLDPATGELSESPHSLPIEPGSGPRHCAFAPDGRHLYLVNELSSTVTVIERNAATGHLTTMQTVSALPPGFTGESTCAAIRVHPSGRFLYASNRGDDSVVCFAVDEAGRLAPVAWEPTGGRTPREIALSPDGRYLLAANQDSDSVVTLSIDADSGRLSCVRSVEVPTPVCLAFAD